MVLRTPALHLTFDPSAGPAPPRGQVGGRGGRSTLSLAPPGSLSSATSIPSSVPSVSPLDPKDLFSLGCLLLCPAVLSQVALHLCLCPHLLGVSLHPRLTHWVCSLCCLAHLFCFGSLFSASCSLSLCLSLSLQFVSSLLLSPRLSPTPSICGA